MTCILYYLGLYMKTLFEKLSRIRNKLQGLIFFKAGLSI